VCATRAHSFLFAPRHRSPGPAHDTARRQCVGRPAVITWPTISAQLTRSPPAEEARGRAASRTSSPGHIPDSPYASRGPPDEAASQGHHQQSHAREHGCGHTAAGKVRCQESRHSRRPPTAADAGVEAAHAQGQTDTRLAQVERQRTEADALVRSPFVPLRGTDSLTRFHACPFGSLVLKLIFCVKYLLHRLRVCGTFLAVSFKVCVQVVAGLFELKDGTSI